jgi:photosystem II stability/assembly factor-like uncharacterized protein
VSQLVPVESQAAYVGPDGQFQAYVANADDEPQICISHDGGRTFTPSRLTVSTLVAPTGVLFTSEQVGLTWYSNIFGAGDAYLRRTTDGGATWSEVPLPAEIQGVRLSLRELFFAPGNTTGWLVGFLPDTRKPLVLKTRDGGASFAVVDGGLGDVLDDVPLFTGFALDEDHVWVGGERGGLAFSASGGE